MLEPITAGGGLIEPVPEYFPIITEICRKYEVLLHIDEVVCGFELVEDRENRTPVQENYVASISAECKRRGLLIGRTNRSFADWNNTVCLTPALIASKSDIDDIVGIIDDAMEAIPHG